MTEQSVAIKADFRIEDTKVAALHDDKRIDFQHRHVLLGEGFVEDREQFHTVFAGGAGQRQRIAKLTCSSFGHAFSWINGQRQDLFRRVMRDRLNVHAAFG